MSFASWPARSGKRQVMIVAFTKAELAEIARADAELNAQAAEKRRAWQRAYYQKNKGKIHQYYLDNQERIKARCAAYREKNRDKIREKNRKRYELNKESLAAARYAKAKVKSDEPT